MKHEYTEHEEKRNNGANSPFQLGETDRKHIAGIGVDVPCAKRGKKEPDLKAACRIYAYPLQITAFTGCISN